MNVKDLIFFQKEGYQINMSYDEENDRWTNKIYFDKNSVDTFKTQGIYVFEKVEGTNNTFNASLNAFYLYNQEDISIIPKNDAKELIILDIKKVNNDSNYYTKWIYATDIHKTYEKGQWIYFTGLDSYHTDFETYKQGSPPVSPGEILNLYKIIDIEPNRILISTITSNNNSLPAYTYNINNKIIPIDVIEYYYETSSPDNGLMSANYLDEIYSGKKISLVLDSENTGVYTLKDKTSNYTYDYNKLSPYLYSPNAGDKLRINLVLRTSNIKVAKGIKFDNTTDLYVEYIPSYVKIGDTLQAVPTGLVSLTGSNNNTMTITGLDYSTNVIEVSVSGGLVNQTVEFDVYFSTNIFVMEQDILLNNNNQYSLPLTYWALVNKYAGILENMPGGGILKYLPETDELQYTSNVIRYDGIPTTSYTGSTVEYIDINGGTHSLGSFWDSINYYNTLVLPVNESLKVNEEISKDASKYYRKIVFEYLDDFGLNININGNYYSVDRDLIIGNDPLTVQNTISDFIDQFQEQLSYLGIEINQETTVNAGDTLTIEAILPSVNIFCDLKLGDNSRYYVKYRDIQFGPELSSPGVNYIKSQLLININSKDYLVPFNTDDITTITNWVNTYRNILSPYGIIVSNTDNIIHINTQEIEPNIKYTYNIGYIPKSGDLSVYETVYLTNSKGSVISGNEINIQQGVYNFTDYYSTGQKITISGADKKYNNKSYNIIGLTPSKIYLSYQGAFSDQSEFSMNIVSDYFIRYPKHNLTDLGVNNARINISFKDTQIPDFFFYDFSGNQLIPANNLPEYSGIKPLCGADGEIELKLIKEPNTDIIYINEPTKQQTVFDQLNYELPYLDDNTNNGIEPEPLQLFIGYRAEFESWSKSRIYISLIEDVKYEVSTALNNNNLVVFENNYLEIRNATDVLNFNSLGFKVNQIIEIGSKDISSDNQQIVNLSNKGVRYKIIEVLPNKLVFDENVIEEESIKSVGVIAPPFYDVNGNPNMITRNLSVSITVVDRVIAYFDIFGESEEEDERHKINLNNKNLNILKLQDTFIFKEVDINEEGIDWIFLNRKRKELLEIYPQIFNYLSSYKSIIQAINFFGYNDLVFTEYFKNMNPDSKKFGQMFNMDLLNLFDKSVSGWEYSNLAYENLRNLGYRKTNLFSLNYMITDNDGNFVESYSLDEVRIKLLGLKKWLTENIIPLGTKILDINGKYKMPNNFSLKHSTNMVKRFNVEEYAAPVDFKVKGFTQPIEIGSNSYFINVSFIKDDDNFDFFSYKIKTFLIDLFDENVVYNIGDKIYYNGKVWKKVMNGSPDDGIPEENNGNWEISNIDTLLNNQVISGYNYDGSDISFSIDKTVDPHFIVEVYWHSGYALSHKVKRSYSVIPEFFN